MRPIHVAACAAWLAACGRTPAASPAGDAGADRIFVNGTVVTMHDALPVAEALAVKDGRIVAVGHRAEVERLRGAATTVTDLRGRALLPGFIDAHGHIVDYTLQWNTPTLSPPPVGKVSTLADLQATLRAHLAATKAGPDTLVVAQGYDDGLLTERRHPTRADLDAVSTSVPILVVHASGHLAVANTPALALVGYSRATADPAGGVIRRHPKTGEPNGILEEKALYPFLPLLPRASEEEQLRLLDEVQRWYASFGITTAQDGLTAPPTLTLLRRAAREDRLLLDVVSYPMWTLLSKVVAGEARLEGVALHPPGARIDNAGRGRADNRRAPTPAALGDSTAPQLRLGAYEGRLKVAGVKISADGSPQGKTAYLTAPYLHPPEGQPASYRAYPVVEQAEMDQWFDAAYRHGVQLQVHVNGDAAIDILLRAVARARRTHGPKDLRPVAIHAQTARADQVDSMAALGVVPSFFTAHTFFWGDWHAEETLGPERAAHISPLARALAAGLRFSNHNDAPVVPPDMLLLAWTAVNRQTRSGAVLGPDERVTPLVALKAMTIWAAYQYFEEAEKGSLEPGKRADLVILAEDPLTAPPERLKDIAVEETIKDGRTIFTSAEGRPRGPAR